MVWGQVGMGRSVEVSSVNLILNIELQYADHSTDLYMYQFVCCVCMYMYVYVWDCVTACVEQVSFSVVQTRMG